MERRSLTKRDLTSVPDSFGNQCPVNTDTLAGEMLLYFNGIFFDDFITGGGQDILGPLAVGGTFTAPYYVVNANERPDCSANIHDSFLSYGLVVGGLTDTIDTDVHGSALLGGGGDETQIHEADPPCEVYTDENTGRFDFEVAREASEDISELLALSTPNYIFRNSGEMVNLGGDSQVKIMTFNTCNNRNCPVDEALSDPTGIFFDDDNFNGPYGDVPSEDSTLVFNIPVLDGETIRLTGNQPSKGFNSCRTIYNFYPVNEAGQFKRDGTFTLIRETKSQLEGFSLAPRGHIRDGLVGNFAGTIVGLDYTWEYYPNGVEIHNYEAAGCDNFDGCLPVNPGGSTTTTTTTTTTTQHDVTTETTTVASTTVTTTTIETQEVPTTVTESSTATETTTETAYIKFPHHNKDHKKGKKKWDDKKKGYDKKGWNDKKGGSGDKKSWDDKNGKESWGKKDGGKKWGKDEHHW
ncbi:hypothetical protein BDA99DRAFT_503449 [Phascolomyces articulosus]|uniref:Choice-of-anchor A domain-containing protein n=1 Tax=Phascolomyces articulosus TaxID=60185 RepID=A0AAD5KEC5_9FUNG|nr:hypothetical protein BDA99DRAFT_503449 [Phascolomyces articulosus]